jgi:4-carboxymuconolactone decarboxylase
MSRLAALNPEALDANARAVYDHIASAHKGHVRGPWPIELRVPELADLSHKLYERLCVHTTLGKRLFELMVIIVARHWNSQFEFWAHERLAREHGISEAVTSAIRANRRPTFEHDDEALVYDLTMEINELKTLSDASYKRGVAFFGEEKLVEFTIALGYYTMLAVHLNVFAADIPPDVEPLR